MKLPEMMIAALAAVSLSCVDVPAEPDVAGVNLAEVDFHPDDPSTLKLRVSVSDRFGFPWLDSETTRVYVRQLLKNGTAVRSITELGGEDKACGYARPLKTPSAVAFVLDRSGQGDEVDHRSVLGGVLDAIHDADPRVRFGVVDFGSEAIVDQAVTDDRDAVEAAIRAPRTRVGTAALFEGIVKGVDLVSSSVEDGEHGAVVVVTASLNEAGGATHSYGSVIEHAKMAGVPIYVIAYDQATRGTEAENLAMDDVAIMTGGRYISGGDAIYASGVIGSVVASIHAAYEVCVDALPVDHGNRYADSQDMSEITVTVESLGSDLESARPF